MNEVLPKWVFSFVMIILIVNVKSNNEPSLKEDLKNIPLHHEQIQDTKNKQQSSANFHETSDYCYVSSHWLIFRRAREIGYFAQLTRSIFLLEKSILKYKSVLDLADVPPDLYLLTANEVFNGAMFRGWVQTAFDAKLKLADKFPNDLQYLNDYGSLLLSVQRYDEAKNIFENVLHKNPANGIALVHYGYILKVVKNRLEESVDYLRRGISSGEKGTQEYIYFRHLGDTLRILNRLDEAYDVYEEGARKGVFLSKYQRSSSNVPGLTARPWWMLEQTGYEKQLKRVENSWETIREEGLALLNLDNVTFVKEAENLTKEGDWRDFVLYRQGKKLEQNCLKAPKTCAIVEQFPESVSCTRCQIKFSVIKGGTKIWPHCGTTNCRLRGHLGLVVPPEPRIKVVNETKEWLLGKFIVFDDSFEHEVWYEGSGFRLVLIVDFWHPELTPYEKETLTPI